MVRLVCRQGTPWVQSAVFVSTSKIHTHIGNPGVYPGYPLMTTYFYAVKFVTNVVVVGSNGINFILRKVIIRSAK